MFSLSTCIHPQIPSNKQDLTNPSFIQKFALELIKSRKSNYSEDCINYYLNQNKFIVQQLLDVRNKYNHQLRCTLIRHKRSLLEKIQQDFAVGADRIGLKQKNAKKQQKQQTGNQQKYKHHHQENPQKCIVYVHGLGSNRMEGFSMLPTLPKDYCLLTFDLSASGKSEGEYITYGYRQKEDIQAVLVYLYQKKSLREFVIWGRSMGAVASLLFNNHIGDKLNQTIHEEYSAQSYTNYLDIVRVYQCVKCIVADSPFCSFQQISKDIALNKMSIPTFLTDIALKLLEKVFQNLLFNKSINKSFSPFQIDFLSTTLKPVIPIIFVYSLNDEIVNCEHSQRIIKSTQKSYLSFVQKVIIPQCGHNVRRPENAIETIFQKIRKHTMISRKMNNSFQKTTQIVNSMSEISKDNKSLNKSLIKNVRRKSYWNFQEQIFTETQNQTIQLDNHHLKPHTIKNQNSITHQAIQPQNSNKKQENITVRKSIFIAESNKPNIDQAQIQAAQRRSIKKRGLSLSSTIQRTESMSKNDFKSILNKPFQTVEHSDNSRPGSVHSRGQVGSQKRKRNFSVELGGKNVNQDRIEQTISPHKKGLLKHSVNWHVDILNERLRESSKKRPSLAAAGNRVVLGGTSIQKIKRSSVSRVNRQTLSQISRQKQNVNRVQHQLQRGKSDFLKGQLVAQRDCPRDVNYMSMISLTSQHIQAQTSSLGNIPSHVSQPRQAVSKGSLVSYFNIQSQPNIANQEQNEFRRYSSRNSFKTIDNSLIRNQIDEGVTKFINHKLQWQRDRDSIRAGTINKFNQNNEQSTRAQNKKSSLRIFSKFKTIQLGGCQSKQIGQSRQNNQLNHNKQSQLQQNIEQKPLTPFSHTSLRPTSRLYHQKRKKKMLQQNMLNQKINNSFKITNQKYLIEQ